MTDMTAAILIGLRMGPDMGGDRRVRLYINSRIYDMPEERLVRWLARFDRSRSRDLLVYRERLHTALAAADNVVFGFAGAVPGDIDRMRRDRTTDNRLLALRIESWPLTCAVCGKELTPLHKGRGRPRTTCSQPCRQEKYLARALKSSQPMAGRNRSAPSGAGRYRKGRA
ncbi:hypothetical protein KDK95_05655 [Actinospica sp. MGRD01-02]|uniref:Uncharacterized protein n=1 Tax=Actinospica acidithermotolerans TaxID=2828514 RepID=A0A941E413_9ACTN|nr:hypothetical protein [Actinospica acidithermotolerans]MBR7825785.1 hypothetical protein [Actinospica acidithermotolerans]